ncbi:unnamed protein product [Aphanomyces euteiches]
MESLPLLPKPKPRRGNYPPWLMLVIAFSTVLALCRLAWPLSQATAVVNNHRMPPPPNAVVRTVQITMHWNTTTQTWNPRAIFDVPDNEPKAAFATFNDSVPLIGWSQLWLRTHHDDFNTAMFAAGYAEAAVTHRRIAQHYKNTWSYFFTNDTAVAAKVTAFLERNFQWMTSQVAEHAANSTAPASARRYWRMVGGILAQLEGLSAGYKAFTTETKSLTRSDFLFLNADGDMGTLIAAVDGRDPRAKEPPNFKCSALIRLLPDDLLWGHATWDTYTAMNKMFKHYNVPLPDDYTSFRRISMASSPGYLSSVDDWYLVDNGLGVLETTNGIFTQSLLSLIKPQSCLSWIRAKVANALAHDGQQWTDLFALFNSGTYNNQWMILDTRRFHNGSMEPQGLMVLEQIPGRVVVRDVSAVLNSQGYWGSYNIPYFEAIYNESGFAKLTGDTWSHQNCSRAKIFARDAPKVNSLAVLKHLLRYNDFQHDPLSFQDPGRSVAARYDLSSTDFALNGAIDAKVTSLLMAKKLECDAILGPTNDNQPTFVWTHEFDKLASHLGQPTVFNFSFEPMRHSAHLEN